MLNRVVACLAPLTFALGSIACSPDDSDLELDEDQGADETSAPGSGAGNTNIGGPSVGPSLPNSTNPLAAGSLDADALCKGYLEIVGPATVSMFRPYTSSVESTCRALVGRCNQGVTDTSKILCSALEFAGVYYGNGYSTPLVARRRSPSTASPPRPTTTVSIRSRGSRIVRRGSRRTTCSSAPGSRPSPSRKRTASRTRKRSTYCSGQFTSERNPNYFTAVADADLRAGDFLTRSFGCNSSDGSGHVAIAAAPPIGSSILVFETNAWKKPARFSEKTLADFPGGRARFKESVAN